MLPEIGSRLYHTLVPLVAKLGNKKAQKWVNGRKEITAKLTDIADRRKAEQPLIWMHAASLGEFEQGAPVFEALKAAYPSAFMVLSFFSPSGYEARKHYTLADAVLYLPHDRPKDANNWVNKLRPSLAIFIKYEFWPYHLKALKAARIPTVLIAASFRPKQAFFKWYGLGWRKLLDCFDQLIVQTDADAQLLASIGLDEKTVTVAGDPRADRVLKIADTAFSNDIIADFSANHKILLAGSVWANDVAILLKLQQVLNTNWRIILAPHQLKETEITSWTSSSNGVRYTAIKEGQSSISKDTQVLILDTIGILSKAYRYADLAYVGGGFGTSIHNTLEPMAYDLPVLFGPKYHKFPEAVKTVAAGGSFSVQSATNLIDCFQRLEVPDNYQLAVKAIREYTDSARGATARSLEKLKQYLS